MGFFDRIKRKSTSPSATKSVSTALKSDMITTGQVTILAGILVQPLVTEKSTATGTYYFEVARTTNKQEVAKAFKATYGKIPRKVNIINRRGKVVRRGRIVSQQSNWKKAIIYLNKGESVDLFKQ